MKHCPVTGLVDCDCGACEEDDEQAEGVAQAWRDDGSEPLDDI